MNNAVKPLAACAPLLALPAMNAPVIDTWRASNNCCADTFMIRRSASSVNVASAITRRPRVSSVFSCECFLSVSMLPDSMKRG